MKLLTPIKLKDVGDSSGHGIDFIHERIFIYLRTYREIDAGYTYIYLVLGHMVFIIAQIPISHYECRREISILQKQREKALNFITIALNSRLAQMHFIKL